MVAWLIIIGVAVLLLFLYFKYFKIPKMKNLIFVDGGPGAGKSATSVYFAIRLYKRNHWRWAILNRLKPVLGLLPPFKKALEGLEEPMLYSNMPLRRIKFSNLTLDILERKTRVARKSVILIDECSIIFDQFDYKDRALSDSLRDFFKLYRHESHGGYIVINSQSTADLHYAVKSVLSDYIYIHHKSNLPFFCALRVQEMAYSSDADSSSIVNAQNGDIEKSLMLMLMPKSVFKRYDTYYLSILTDGLPLADDWYIIDKKESAKVRHVLTYKKGRYDL